MKLLRITGLILILCLGTSGLLAQNAYDALRYSIQQPSLDASSMVYPSVASPGGAGTVQDNPASMALFEQSLFSGGLSFRNPTEEANFLGATHEFSDSQFNVSDIGLVYRVPTARGSLVVGGSYSQSADFNRAFGYSARNNRSTLTDYYNLADQFNSDLYDAAFDVYAIDYLYEDPEDNTTESIFRIGFDDYPGIDQDVEQTEQGRMGEYAFFLATEFQENLMVGVSLGASTGRYEYRRDFLETDSQNDYDGDFIDSDGDDEGETDIDNILSIDEIENDFTALSLRVGAVYRVFSNLNVGFSYQFPQTMSFEEDYRTAITSTFDNGDFFEDDETVNGFFSYKIKRPARLNAGLNLTDIGGLSVGASIERVDHSEAELDFEGSDLSFQNDENNFIKSEFQEVYNVRLGLEFALNPSFRPRVGYAYYPSPERSFDVDRTYYSGGVSMNLAQDVIFDLGVQYGSWDDEMFIYSYDNGSGIVDETASQEASRWHVMGGLKFIF